MLLGRGLGRVVEGRPDPVIEAVQNEQPIAKTPRRRGSPRIDLLFLSAILGVFGASAIGPSMEFAGFTR